MSQMTSTGRNKPTNSHNNLALNRRYIDIYSTYVIEQDLDQDEVKNSQYEVDTDYLERQDRAAFIAKAVDILVKKIIKDNEKDDTRGLYARQILEKYETVLTDKREQSDCVPLKT